MRKLFFIVGLRRSGTSILRELILKHPDVGTILFEPYALWHSIRVSHLARYRGDPYVKRVLTEFKNRPVAGKWNGAKFAINPGMEGMTWRRLALVFPEAKFIFIERKAEHTYQSWLKQDIKSVRGICDKPLYMGFRNHIVQSFKEFNLHYPKKSTIINYEELLKYTDSELLKVWETLGIRLITDFRKYIKQPEHRG